jgi:hypothetical protein
MNYKTQLYLSIFTIVIAIIGVFFFAICPIVSSIKDNSYELLNDRRELASIEYLTKSFEDFEKNFILYKEGLEEMEGLLSNESLIDPEIPIEFINFFKEQSSALDLNLRILPIQDPIIQEEYWNSLKFRITGIGRVDHMRSFIEKIENSKWLLGINEISINIYKEDLENPTRDYVAINIVIKIYAQD